LLNDTFDIVSKAFHHTIHGRSCVMSSKTVRRSIQVRRSPVPPSGGVASGYMGLLAKLSGASDRLAKARRRK
jgi:hypothetical protein